jgi:hypothetical protein
MPPTNLASKLNQPESGGRTNVDATAKVVMDNPLNVIV